MPLTQLREGSQGSFSQHMPFGGLQKYDCYTRGHNQESGICMALEWCREIPKCIVISFSCDFLYWLPYFYILQNIQLSLDVSILEIICWLPVIKEEDLVQWHHFFSPLSQYNIHFLLISHQCFHYYGKANIVSYRVLYCKDISFLLNSQHFPLELKIAYFYLSRRFTK